MAQVRANNLIQEYVTNSFMSANEKFNSALVFETLPEQINLKNEEEKGGLAKRIIRQNRIGYGQDRLIVQLPRACSAHPITID